MCIVFQLLTCVLFAMTSVTSNSISIWKWLEKIELLWHHLNMTKTRKYSKVFFFFHYWIVDRKRLQLWKKWAEWNERTLFGWFGKIIVKVSTADSLLVILSNIYWTCFWCSRCDAFTIKILYGQVGFARSTMEYATDAKEIGIEVNEKKTSIDLHVLFNIQIRWRNQRWQIR